MSDSEDFNARVIEEFRANEGKVGGFFADKDLLLLHTVGARSGEARIHPLVCMEEDGKLYIIASAAGSSKHPAWFHNLVANSIVDIEIGTERFQANAVIAGEPERSSLYAKAAVTYRFFKEYEEKTAGIRTIPVILLNRL